MQINEDNRNMTIKVRHLSEYEIEKDADLLLAEYAQTTGASVKLPVPVDQITTYHLALQLEFADLHETLHVPMLHDQPDILGAIWVEKELVLIDHHLDPKNNPHMLGRYHFSVAHEVGHWRLHRSYVAKDSNQTFLFDAPSEPTVICRSSQRKEPIEWQADYFASCLLMPRRRVLDEWDDFLNDRIHTPSVLRAALPNGMIVKHSQGMICAQRHAFPLGHDALCLEIAHPIAERFGVSGQAMRIRLEKLGLLPRQNQNKATLRAGV
jgi:hypothetical protein